MSYCDQCYYRACYPANTGMQGPPAKSDNSCPPATDCVSPTLDYAFVYSTIPQSPAAGTAFTFNTLLQNNGFSLLNGNTIVIERAGTYRVDFRLTATAPPGAGQFYQVNIQTNGSIVNGGVFYINLSSQLTGFAIVSVESGAALTFVYAGNSAITTASNPNATAPTVAVLLTRYDD